MIAVHAWNPYVRQFEESLKLNLKKETPETFRSLGLHRHVVVLASLRGYCVSKK